MNRDQALALCGGLPGSVEDYPFGDGVAVFKVGGKMFALVSLASEDASVSLKCEPELALDLRERYAAVRPGYHLNKKHWNSVDLDGSIADKVMEEMVEHSYERVVSSLPRAERERLR